MDPPSPASQTSAVSGAPHPTRAHAASSSGGGIAPEPLTGSRPPPGGGFPQSPPTVGTQPPGGTNTPHPGGGHTPPTPSGFTPPAGGTNAPGSGGATIPGATQTAANIAGLDTGSVSEDHNVVAGRLATGGLLTVTDPDAGEEKFQAVTGVSGSAGYGSFSVNENGLWTYTADNSQAVIQALKPSDSLIDRLTVHSADGTTHELRVVITGTNDAPVLRAATATATEDGKTVSGQMSATDMDAGDTKVFSAGHLVDGFMMNADGSWSFDPSHAAYQHLAVGQTQQLTIPVTITDSAGATDTQNLVITVKGSNDGPVVSGPVDLGSGTEDKAVQIGEAQLLAHATDIDTGDTLSVTGLSASHGTISGDAAHGFTFTPDPNYNGPVTLIYQVTDSHGGTVAQTASLTLAATPDAAIITGTDTGSVIEDRNVGPSSAHPLSVGGILSVHDPDGSAFDHFQTNQFGEHAVSDPFGGSLHISRGGIWGYEVDNTNPAIQALAVGEERHAIYEVHAADGTAHRINITVHGTNDAPVLSAATASATEDGKTVTGQMVATDVDHGDSQTYTAGHPVDGFTMNQDGSWSFDPSHAAYQHLAAGQTQQVTIPVTVTDHAGATSTQNLVITVTGSKDGPVVSGPVDLGRGTEDHSVQISAAQLLAHATDIDTGDMLSVTGLTASHGTISGDAAHGFTFTPDPDYNGPVTLSYQVTDGHGGSTAQTASLTLGATPDAAVITGTDTGNVIEDRGVSATGDLQAGGTLTITDPDAGEAAFTPQTGATGSGGYGTFSLDAQGHWTYTADNSQQAIQALGRGQSLTDSLTVTSVDGTRHTLSVEIKGVIDAPALTVTATQGTDSATATAGSVSTATLAAHEDQTIGLGIVPQLVDTDPTETLSKSVVIMGFPHGTTFNHGHMNPGGTGSWLVDVTDLPGLELTPPKDFTGPVTLKVTLVAVDRSPGEGRPAAPSVATLHIDVAPVQDAAVITGTDSGDITEDRNVGRSSVHPLGVSGILTVHDPDGTAFDHFQSNSLGEHAVSDPFGGSLHILPSGWWGYEVDNTNPAIQALAAGEERHAIYEVHAADGTAHRIDITVHGTNDAPVLRAATASATEDGKTVTGQMVATDVDHGDTKTFAVGQAVDGFTMNQDGSWNFDPSHAAYQHLAAGLTQQVTIPVTVTDSAGATDTENLVITVTGSNDGARFTGTDSASVVEDRNLTGGNLTAGGTLTVTDVDTGQDSFTPVTSQQGTGGYGSFSIDEHGHWTYTADNSQHVIQALDPSSTPLTDTLVVTSRDGTQHTLTVAIHGTSDAPVVKPSVATVQGVGSQHLTGTFGGGAPGGWGIDNGHGGSVSSLQGQYGTLIIDPQTGHFEYNYQQNSGVIKHGGSSGASGQHVDTFHIVQQGVAAGDADVQVQINVQSVHGNSGHHVDQTVLQGITFTPVAPVQHDAPDDVDTDEVTLDLTDASTALEHVQETDSTAMDFADTGAGSDDSDANTAPTPAPEGPVAGGIERLSAYFDAIGQGHDAAPSAMAPAAHLSPYLDAAGADPDLATPVADLPDPSTLDIGDLSAKVEDSSGATPEPGPGHDVPQDIPEPVLPDPNDDTSQYG
nr:VCBS domain-containing protein [Stappia sp. BW2]